MLRGRGRSSRHAERSTPRRGSPPRRHGRRQPIRIVSAGSWMVAARVGKYAAVAAASPRTVNAATIGPMASPFVAPSHVCSMRINPPATSNPAPRPAATAPPRRCRERGGRCAFSTLQARGECQFHRAARRPRCRRGHRVPQWSGKGRSPRTMPAQHWLCGARRVRQHESRPGYEAPELAHPAKTPK